MTDVLALGVFVRGRRDRRRRNLMEYCGSWKAPIDARKVCPPLHKWKRNRTDFPPPLFSLPVCLFFSPSSPARMRQIACLHDSRSSSRHIMLCYTVYSPPLEGRKKISRSAPRVKYSSPWDPPPPPKSPPWLEFAFSPLAGKVHAASQRAGVK